MTPEDRDAIRANAAYLRNIRPIDPTEITGYVESHPHPSVVRKVLRDVAVDIGIVEHEDGTFGPSPDEPIRDSTGVVERVPERHLKSLNDILVDRYGRRWHEGESGDRIRTEIRRLKDRYFRGHSVEYDPETTLGYAIYHLPDFYAATQYVIEDLVENHLLGRSLRVLDVGAGVGGPALGLCDRLPEDALVDYHAVEPSPAADVFESLIEGIGRNVHPTIHREHIETFDPPGTFDLVLFANVLSELKNPDRTVGRIGGSLDDEGSIVMLAPADRETSIGLRSIEREVVDGFGVYSPTLRLWPGREPAGRCWSFDVKPDLEIPTIQRDLDEAGGGTGEFINVDVQYSYSILRRDDRRLADIRGDPDRFAPLAETDRHVTERVDCLGVKLSHDLGEDHPVILIGDGSEAVDHFAVRTTRSSLTGALIDAPYASVLRLEGVLVLWNEDEEAYNLVVDDESIVERIG